MISMMEPLGRSLNTSCVSEQVSEQRGWSQPTLHFSVTVQVRWIAHLLPTTGDHAEQHAPDFFLGALAQQRAPWCQHCALRLLGILSWVGFASVEDTPGLCVHRIAPSPPRIEQQWGWRFLEFPSSSFFKLDTTSHQYVQLLVLLCNTGDPMWQGYIYTHHYPHTQRPCRDSNMLRILSVW